MIRKVIIAIVLSLILVQSTAGYSSEPIKPVPQSLFSPVPTDLVVVDSLIPVPITTSRPDFSIREPKIGIIVIGQTPTPSDTLKGKASWYCLPGVSACHRDYRGGMYAAAGPKLRNLLGKEWRGTSISVCKGGNCIRVKLIDWCQCHKGTSKEKLIDLYADAFRKLGRLDSGVIIVKIGVKRD